MPAKTDKNTKKATKKSTGDLLAQIIKKQASLTSKDMKHWREARAYATRVENPRRDRLQDLIKDLLHDTHLSSQIENRRDRNLAERFVLKNSKGEIDEETTTMLNESIAFGETLKIIYETPFFGHSLFELLYSDKDLFKVSLLPRRNVIPDLGFILFDTSGDKGLYYREEKGYGTSILEIGGETDLGIIFDCGPATIYRRYALSSWSELAEIYGIPPRVLKCDTSDDESFARAQEMMQKMGASNWAVVDITEELTFAQGMSDNGQIFYLLIQVAKEEISLKVCGAQIGQDTKHGNRSKEETSQDLLEARCLSDRRTAKKFINNSLLPALENMGIIPSDLSFEYPADEEEDTSELWDRTIQILPYFDVSAEWIKERFGIDVTERKSTLNSAELSAKLSAGEPDFFG